MTSQNLAFISMTLEDKLDESTKFFALKQCENLDDSVVPSLSDIDFKSPVVGLLCQMFLGLLGAGRFYKGNILLGLLYIVSFVLLFVLASYDEDLAMLGLLFYVIAYCVDFFLIYKGIQKDNWQKLQTFLLTQNSHNKPVQNTEKQTQKPEFTQTAQPSVAPLYQMNATKSSNNVFFIFAIVVALIVGIAYLALNQTQESKLWRNLKRPSMCLKEWEKSCKKDMANSLNEDFLSVDLI